MEQNPSDTDSSKTKITIAVIGMIGVLGAAAIAIVPDLIGGGPGISGNFDCVNIQNGGDGDDVQINNGCN